VVIPPRTPAPSNQAAAELQDSGQSLPVSQDNGQQDIDQLNVPPQLHPRQQPQFQHPQPHFEAAALSGSADQQQSPAPIKPVAAKPVVVEPLRPPRTSGPPHTFITAREEEVGKLRTELREERELRAAVQSEFDSVRFEAKERESELKAALDALHEARQQLARRDSEGTKWRAEHSRAIGRLDALAAFSEQQAAKLAEQDGELERYRALLAEERKGIHRALVGASSGSSAPLV